MLDVDAVLEVIIAQDKPQRSRRIECKELLAFVSAVLLQWVLRCTGWFERWSVPAIGPVGP